MKVFIFFVVCIEPAFFLHQQSHLLQNLVCFPEDEALRVLDDNGVGSSTTLSMINSNNYIPGINCSITVIAPKNQYLLLAFDIIDTRPCNEDKIKIETPDSSTTLCGHYNCPAKNCPNVIFENIPNITVEFRSDNQSKGSIESVGFHGLITAYSNVDPSTGECSGNQRFQCANKRCIWEGFECDGNNNCGDNSDERPGCAKTVWGVLVIVLGVLCLCFFMPVFCYLAIWGPKRSVPIRIMGNTLFGPKDTTSVNDEEAVPILLSQPIQGTLPGESFTFYYGTTSSNPRC